MKEQKPLLSVIVPIYNVEKYLTDALDSLCSQTYTNLEIILVNDASTDNSLQICKRYAQKDNRIQIIDSHENIGSSAARNLGIERITGKYVTFFDSDDILHPDAYRIAMETLISSNAQIVRFGYSMFQESPKISPIIRPIDETVYDTPDYIKYITLSLIGRPEESEMPDCDLGGSVWSAIYKTDIILNNSLFFVKSRNITAEDFIINFEYMRYVTKLVMLNVPLYYYRVNPESQTNAPRKSRASEILDTGQYMERLIMRYGFSKLDSKRGMRFAIDVLRAYVKNIVLSEMTNSDKRNCISELASDERVQRLYKEYNWRTMPWKFRMFFLNTAKGRYGILKLMVKASAMIKGE